jgi:hypothetical protein
MTDALLYFHEYVTGKKVTAFTDHQPMVGHSKVHQKTLNRLHLLLNEYDVDLVYRKGSLNSGPDALSRNAVDAVTIMPPPCSCCPKVSAASAAQGGLGKLWLANNLGADRLGEKKILQSKDELISAIIILTDKAITGRPRSQEYGRNILIALFS